MEDSYLIFHSIHSVMSKADIMIKFKTTWEKFSFIAHGAPHGMTTVFKTVLLQRVSQIIFVEIVFTFEWLIDISECSNSNELAGLAACKLVYGWSLLLRSNLSKEKRRIALTIYFLWQLLYLTAPEVSTVVVRPGVPIVRRMPAPWNETSFELV